MQCAICFSHTKTHHAAIIYNLRYNIDIKLCSVIHFNLPFVKKGFDCKKKRSLYDRYVEIKLDRLILAFRILK